MFMNVLSGPDASISRFLLHALHHQAIRQSMSLKATSQR
jgi:hypothetical protein